MMCLGELINLLAKCFSLLVFYEAVSLGIIDNDWIIIMNNYIWTIIKNIVSVLLIYFVIICCNKNALNGRSWPNG